MGWYYKVTKRNTRIEFVNDLVVRTVCLTALLDFAPRAEAGA
jgi:hypothetical protein